ncbi:MAG: hypothetical protein K2W85_05985 [Phycisphaerales bacterium]|nr:hypothetical protein [Phycisphaerales bacterium]
MLDPNTTCLLPRNVPLPNKLLELAQVSPWNQDITRYRSGFPMRSMQYFSVNSTDRLLEGGGWMLPDRLASALGGTETVVPLNILPVGFAFNSLFAAGLVYFFIGGIRFLLGRSRRRHHRCPTCNYNCRDLHSPTCPECGKPHGIHTPATNPHRPTNRPSGPEGATGCSHG